MLSLQTAANANKMVVPFILRKDIADLVKADPDFVSCPSLSLPFYFLPHSSRGEAIPLDTKQPSSSLHRGKATTAS